MGINTISSLFRGVTSSNSSDDVIDTVFRVLPNDEGKNSSTYTQNNPARNQERFFTQDTFSKSNFSSITDKAAQASVSNGSWMPNRLSGNDSRGSLSPFRSSNRELGRELANA